MNLTTFEDAHSLALVHSSLSRVFAGHKSTIFAPIARAVFPPMSFHVLNLWRPGFIHHTCIELLQNQIYIEQEKEDYGTIFAFVDDALSPDPNHIGEAEARRLFRDLRFIERHAHDSVIIEDEDLLDKRVDKRFQALRNEVARAERAKKRSKDEEGNKVKTPWDEDKEYNRIVREERLRLFEESLGLTQEQLTEAALVLVYLYSGIHTTEIQREDLSYKAPLFDYSILSKAPIQRSDLKLLDMLYEEGDCDGIFSVDNWREYSGSSVASLMKYFDQAEDGTLEDSKDFFWKEMPVGYALTLDGELGQEKVEKKTVMLRHKEYRTADPEFYSKTLGGVDEDPRFEL